MAKNRAKLSISREGEMRFSGRCGGALPSGRFRAAEPRGSRQTMRLAPPRALAYPSEYAVLGLTPFASRADVKSAYKRLALKYHPDVIRVEGAWVKEGTFREIKSAYESLMIKLEEEAAPPADCHSNDEWEEWEEWMGFEGGLPIVCNPS